MRPITISTHYNIPTQNPFHLAMWTSPWIREKEIPSGGKWVEHGGAFEDVT